MLLKDKLILVTGATGGIGEEIVTLFSHEGAKLVVIYNSNEEKAQQLKQKFSSIILMKIDFSNPNTIETELDHHKDLLKNIFGLVYAAGVNIPCPLVSIQEKEIDKQLDINLRSAIYLTKYLAKPMVHNREGSIIMLSSVVSQRVARGHAVYSATKAGLEGFTRALASELAKRNIRVNAISPGPVMGDMLEKHIQETGDRPEDRVPMQRLITPREIAETALFLMSDKSRAITGSIIPVDGGYLLW